MTPSPVKTRISERKERDRQHRRNQIIESARRIAEAEGWPHVTVRRLSDEISYSQPVLYSHFESREKIVAAVAVAGFSELGLTLEKARTLGKRGNTAMQLLATAYLDFAVASPALYQAMFSLHIAVPFDHGNTPGELHFAFNQLLKLFENGPGKPAIQAELFWASLHGIAELTRTKRFPPHRQKERIRALIERFMV